MQERCCHKSDTLLQNVCKEFTKTTNKTIFQVEEVTVSKTRNIHASQSLKAESRSVVNAFPAAIEQKLH
jgi:hypothetical protein